MGLGGVGKSQLAIEYAYKKKAETPELYVLWLHAGSATRLDQGVRDILDTLGFDKQSDPSTNDYQLLRGWLIRNRPWLVIVDNADEACHLLGLSSSSADSSENTRFDYIPTCDHGSVLLTTRNMDVAVQFVQRNSIISVHLMDKLSAMALIRNKLGNQEQEDSEEDIKKLAVALDCMPLAMAQAAAYISHRSPRCSVRQYLKDLESSPESRLNLLDIDMADPQRDRKANNSILRTWQISFEYINRTKPSAADLLGLMSFYDRQSVPDVLLKAASPILAVEETPRRLESHDKQRPSWLRKLETFRLHFRKHGTGRSEQTRLNSNPFTDGQASFTTGEDLVVAQTPPDYSLEDDIQLLRSFSFTSVAAGTQAFEMHALVQLATQRWLKSNAQYERLMHLAILRLYKALPSDDEGFMSWESSRGYHAFVPHITAISQLKVIDRTILLQQATIGGNSAIYYVHEGQYETARKLLERWLKVFRDMKGDYHPRTLQCLDNLANVYMEEGQFQKSTEIHSHVLSALRRICGDEDPRTYRSMQNLGGAYQHQGRYVEAEDLQLSILDYCRRVKGEKSRETLLAMSSLAWTRMRQRKLDEAEQLLRQVTTIRDRMDEKDPDIALNDMRALSMVYAVRGRSDQARDLRLRIWNLSTKLLGLDHPDTSEDLLHLAEACRQSEHLIEIDEHVLHEMQYRENMHGADHPDALKDKLILGLYYGHLGRDDAVITLLEPAIGVMKRVLGEEDQVTIDASATLASTYHDLGRFEEAKVLGEKVLELESRILGSSHQSTLLAMSNLSESVYRLGHRRSAIHLMARCVALSRETLGPLHEATVERCACLEHMEAEANQPKETGGDVVS